MVFVPLHATQLRTQSALEMNERGCDKASFSKCASIQLGSDDCSGIGDFVAKVSSCIKDAGCDPSTMISSFCQNLQELNCPVCPRLE